jgi:hypothetical protein
MKIFTGSPSLLDERAAFAQTTGTVNPSASSADSTPKEHVPPGGCMPIGMTASGETVFPIQCRELIERERGKIVEQNPSAGGGEETRGKTIRSTNS